MEIKTEDNYPLCNKAVDSDDHLFVECVVALQVWELCQQKLVIQF